MLKQVFACSWLLNTSVAVAMVRVGDTKVQSSMAVHTTYNLTHCFVGKMYLLTITRLYFILLLCNKNVNLTIIAVVSNAVTSTHNK